MLLAGLLIHTCSASFLIHSRHTSLEMVLPSMVWFPQCSSIQLSLLKFTKWCGSAAHYLLQCSGFPNERHILCLCLCLCLFLCLCLCLCLSLSLSVSLSLCLSLSLSLSLTCPQLPISLRYFLKFLELSKIDDCLVTKSQHMSLFLGRQSISKPQHCL